MSNRGCACTATRIEYVPPEDNGGVETWRCTSCGAKFQKVEECSPS